MTVSAAAEPVIKVADIPLTPVIGTDTVNVIDGIKTKYAEWRKPCKEMGYYIKHDIFTNEGKKKGVSERKTFMRATSLIDVALVWLTAMCKFRSNTDYL